MSPLSIVAMLFCVLAFSVEGIQRPEEKATIFIPYKPQGTILQDGYQIVFPGPADLSAVFSQSYQQIVVGIGNTLHATVEYLTRLVG